MLGEKRSLCNLAKSSLSPMPRSVGGGHVSGARSLAGCTTSPTRTSLWRVGHAQTWSLRGPRPREVTLHHGPGTRGQDLAEKMLGDQRKSGHIQPVSPTNPARAPLTGALGTPSRAPLKHEEVQGGPAASAALTTPTERSCQAPSREVGGGMSDHVSVPVPRAVPDPSDIQRCDGDLPSLGEAPAR